jgi:PhzF family phenazine biosynthesis protein
MKIPMFQVDAFTRKVFGGNPAAVCVLDTWLDDEILRSIAAENNLPETAFIVKGEEFYELRWFTPKVEMDLCGHATLASAFVIFSFIEKGLSSVAFNTASGVLKVERYGDTLSMDFPARKPVKTGMRDILAEALGIRPKETYKSRDLMAVFDNESQIRRMSPDFEKLGQIRDCFAVIVSAPGDYADFVSRFFAPNAGIPEDPVTGSAHCTLIPFWAERLGKSKLHALQLSPRGGELHCEDMGERVKISGNAVLFSKGEIHL